MEYRKLGKTGLKVSALSFGASSLGGVFRQVDESEGVRTVREAVDLGINLIDVSPYYGLTRAETVLGKAIREMPRDSFLLSTKAGRYGEREFDFSPDRLRRSVEESLQRLHTDYVDILFLHDIEFVPLGPVLEESLPALEKLKEQGKVRFIGVSGLPLKIFRTVLGAARIDAVLSYCHYSLNDDSLLELLPLIGEKGVGLVNASPLSMGLLGSRGAPDWHPAGPGIREACARAARFCERKGSDLAKLAIQFSVSHPDIPTTLVSTGNPGNIRKNVQWAQEPIDTELLREVRKILEPVHNRTWLSGLPENNDKEMIR